MAPEHDDVLSNPLYLVIDARLQSSEKLITESMKDVKDSQKETRQGLMDLVKKHDEDVEQLHSRISKHVENQAIEQKEMTQLFISLQHEVTRIANAPWRWAVVVIGAAVLGGIAMALVELLRS